VGFATTLGLGPNEDLNKRENPEDAGIFEVFQDPRTREDLRTYLAETWRTRAIGRLKYEAITRAGDSRAASLFEDLSEDPKNIGTVQKYENPDGERGTLQGRKRRLES
jgi:hypothetical protein